MLIAMLRQVAMIRGACPVRTCEASSANVTSRTLLCTWDDRHLGGLPRSVEGVVEAGCRIGQLRESLGLPFLLGDVPQAFLEPGHLAEPLHLVGFVESFPGVGLDLEEAR